MSDDELPTIGEAISNWLGVQLPSIPLRQTMRNIDKAIAKIVLAGGENIEARIKGNTAKAKAHSKINVEGMFRNEEEKRKLENRAAVMKAALEDIEHKPNSDDAPREIEDDWLNMFVRAAEDKSSEELRQLFGKILSGEIRRPGSFSLRTMQIMSTISKTDAETLSKLLSYAIDERVVPFRTNENEGDPTAADRLFLEELGVAGHPTQIGGMQLQLTVAPKVNHVSHAIELGLVVENKTDHPVDVSITGQVMTRSGQEIAKIANPPATDLEFLKDVARQMLINLKATYAADVENGAVRVHVATTTQNEGDHVVYRPVYTPD